MLYHFSQDVCWAQSGEWSVGQVSGVVSVSSRGHEKREGHRECHVHTKVKLIWVDPLFSSITWPYFNISWTIVLIFKCRFRRYLYNNQKLAIFIVTVWQIGKIYNVNLLPVYCLGSNQINLTLTHKCSVTRKSICSVEGAIQCLGLSASHIT